MPPLLVVINSTDLIKAGVGRIQFFSLSILLRCELNVFYLFSFLLNDIKEHKYFITFCCCCFVFSPRFMFKLRCVLARIGNQVRFGFVYWIRTMTKCCHSFSHSLLPPVLASTEVKNGQLDVVFTMPSIHRDFGVSRCQVTRCRETGLDKLLWG